MRFHPFIHHFHSFTSPLSGFTRHMPPLPYSDAAVKRGFNSGSHLHSYFFDHTKVWRIFPGRVTSSALRPPQDNTAFKTVMTNSDALKKHRVHSRVSKSNDDVRITLMYPLINLLPTLHMCNEECSCTKSINWTVISNSDPSTKTEITDQL